MTTQQITTRQLVCENLSCVTTIGRDADGLLISVFPKHHYLFRSALSSRALLETASWFSDSAVALKYKDQLYTCRRYTANRDLNLISTYDPETIDAILQSPKLTDREKLITTYLTGKNVCKITDSVRRSKLSVQPEINVYPPHLMRFAPHGFYVEEDRKTEEYINLKFAKIVCKLGYDGWFIKKDSVVDLFSGGYAWEEIMLCRSQEVLTQTSFGCSVDSRLTTFNNSPGNCSPVRSNVEGIPLYLRSYCDLIPLRNVKKIYGPMSYSEHVKDDKRICIFGEQYETPKPLGVNQSNTTAVPFLLRAMLETHPDRFYDFFLEYDYIKSDGQVRTGIDAFDRIFGDCLKVVKNCRFDNLRAHYADYRSVLGHDYRAILADKEAYPFYGKENLKRLMTDTITRVRQFIVNDSKLVKTIDHHISSFIFMIMDAKIVLVSKLVDAKDVWTAKQKHEAFAHIYSLYALVMDAYMLGRIFKTFDVSKNPTHPSHANNCIVYVSDYNAAVYRMFLKQQGFEQVIKITGDHIIEFTEEQRRTSFLFN